MGKIKNYNDISAFLQNVFDININVIDKVFESYSNNNSEFSKIHSKLSKLEKINVAPNRLSNDDGKILYSIIRIKNPKNIIETGVATGYSSSIVLMALNENHHGLLTSIDYPNYKGLLKKINRDITHKGFTDTFFSYHGIRSIGGYILRPNYYHIPNGEESGWVVPKRFKKKWILNIGLSSKLLKSELKKLKEIDIFFHDSDHSKNNMLYEFETAWPFINNNGFIISDDINLNNAFEEFCKKVPFKKAAMFDNSFGIIVK